MTTWSNIVDVVVADLLDGPGELDDRLRALAVGDAGELDGEFHGGRIMRCAHARVNRVGSIDRVPAPGAVGGRNGPP